MQEPDINFNSQVNEEEKNDFQEIQEQLNVHQEAVKEMMNDAIENIP